MSSWSAMPIMIEVTCSRKERSASGATEITQVGGRNRNNAWVLTEKVAIAGMECKAIDLYIRVEGRILGLFVLTGPKGHKRLSAGAGEEGTDRLIALPDCSETA